MDVVRECAEAWEKLITGATDPGDVSMFVTLPRNLQMHSNTFIVPTSLSSTHPPVSPQRSFLMSQLARISPLPQLTPALTSGSSSPELPHKLLDLPITYKVSFTNS